MALPISGILITALGNCNAEMVDLDDLETDANVAELRQLIENRLAFTGSTVAESILANWNESVINSSRSCQKTTSVFCSNKHSRSVPASV